MRITSTLILCGILALSSSSSGAFASPTGGSKADGASSNARPGNAKSLELNEEGIAAVKNRDFKAAEDKFRLALAADSKNVTAAYNLAGMYLTNKKEDLAVTLLEGYVADYPKDAGLYARLGDSYFGTKNIDKAVSAYERSLQLDRQNPPDRRVPGVSVKLATLYTMTQRLDKAETMLLQATDQDPKNGQVLTNLSAVFLANKKPEKAVSTAKRAIQIHPTKELYVTLGSAYEELKDFKNALIAYERSADLGEASSEVQDKIAELKKISTNDKA